MRTLAMTVVSGMALFAIGCGDQPTQPRAANRALAPELSKSSTSSDKPEGIAGAAEFVYVDGLGESFTEHFDNAATQKKDGTIRGEFEWKQRGSSTSAFDAEFGGEITCFAISGQSARVSGRIKRSNSSHLPPGTYVIWEWRDNDNVGKKAPDTSTNFFVADAETAARHCDLGGVLEGNVFYPATHGKLEILHDDH